MRARRLPVVDEYADGDQMAVFIGDQVMVLSVVASAALDALDDDWAELSAVTKHLNASVGSPPGGDTESGARELLAELAGHGLVEIE